VGVDVGSISAVEVASGAVAPQAEKKRSDRADTIMRGYDRFLFMLSSAIHEICQSESERMAITGAGPQAAHPMIAALTTVKMEGNRLCLACLLPAATSSPPFSSNLAYAISVLKSMNSVARSGARYKPPGNPDGH
jgi:hypothetical protein